MKGNIFPVPFVLIFITYASQSLRAQEQPGKMITDRPDITESAVAVPPGYLQIENGFAFENKKIYRHGLTGDVRNYTISGMLFRYGLLKNVELRVGENYLFQKSTLNNSESTETGISDFLAGAKFQMLEENLNKIDLGFIVQFHLPIGNEALRPESTESELLISLGESLNNILSFSGNIGTHWDSNLGRFIYIYSGSVGIDLNYNWGAFAEIYGGVSSKSRATFMYDFGFSYKPVSNFQVDFSAGTDSFSDYNYWFAGTGVSVRFPH